MNIYKIDGKLLRKLFEQAYLNINEEKELINSMNVFPVPDGDTGTNMTLTIKSSVDMMKKINSDDINEIAKIVAKGALMGARGNSGVILSQIFGGFQKGLVKTDAITVEQFYNAMKSAVTTSYKSVMNPVEGTILTVCRESVEGLEELDFNNIDFSEFFFKLLVEAEKSLDNTPNVLNVLKQANVVDSGGRGLVSVYRAFYNTILGKEVVVDDSKKIEESDSIFEHGIEEFNTQYIYCTEFIINNLKGDVKKLKEKVLKMGDSIVFVEDDDIVKVHVHTDNPGNTLSTALKYGDIYKTKIENMKVQYDSIVKEEEEKKEIGFISVSSGDGFRDIFYDLGVDRVIEGGQTMNPSTEDIIKNINSINADKIVILPNNSNIILSSNQAKELSEKEIIVLPTKTIPEGISAMIRYDNELSLDELEEEMKDGIEDVDTLQITYAVRNSIFDGLKINAKDIISLFNGKIYSKSQNAEKMLYEAIKNLSKDYDLITIYYGENVDILKAEKIVEKLKEEFEDIDFELYHGGQSVYYYILSLE